MNLQDLESFEFIATLGHVSKAGEKLNRTQSALTKCIRRLERETGSKLFRKSGRLLSLTESGQVLLAAAIRIRLSAIAATRHIADLEKGNAGVVRLGIGVPGSRLLPQALSRTLAEAPGTTFEIIVGAVEFLETAMQNDEIDLRIGPFPDAVDKTRHYCFLREEQTVIAVRHNHPLLNAKRRLRITDLKNAAWGLPKSFVGTRQWIDSLLERHGLTQPRVVIETNQIQINPGLISATDLLTVITRRALQDDDIKRQLVELPIQNAVFSRRFGICWKKDGYLSPAAKKLVSIIVEQASLESSIKLNIGQKTTKLKKRPTRHY